MLSVYKDIYGSSLLHNTGDSTIPISSFSYREQYCRVSFSLSDQSSLKTTLHVVKVIYLAHFHNRESFMSEFWDKLDNLGGLPHKRLCVRLKVAFY